MTTTRPNDGPHVLTATRIYGVAIFAIGMAVPHAAIGIVAHWPGQLMGAHVLLIVLLLFAGRNAELAPVRARARQDNGEYDHISQELRNLDR